MTAERPFFITIGVCHTSSAPAAEQLLGGEREFLGGEVVDVGLEQDDRLERDRSRRVAGAASPTMSWQTLGMPMSRVPAP